MRPDRRFQPRYQIGIVAQMLECHPQTLRLYEREGLIEPERSDSGFRLYCDADVELLQRIQSLTQELGVNLAGVHVILKLLEQVTKLSDEIERLRRQIEEGPKALGPASNAARGRAVRIEIEGEEEAGKREPSPDQGAQLSAPVRKVVEMIRDGYDPEKIIIFGSHARGQASKHSDLDVLVVKDTDAREFDRVREVSRLVRPRPLPLDILVKTPEEMEHRLAMGDYFIRDIVDEGVVAYERATG